MTSESQKKFIAKLAPDSFESITKTLVKLEKRQEKIEQILKQKEPSDDEEERLARGYAQLRELSMRHAQQIEKNHQLEKRLEMAENQALHFRRALKKSKNACADKELQIHKAQLYLAKKVKENALLQDLLERQKMQIIELQKTIGRHKEEGERLRRYFHMQCETHER